MDPPDFFTAAHRTSWPSRPSGTILRFLRYPPRSQLHQTTDRAADDDDVRAGAHSDYGSLTLLFRLRGQAGLEVLSKEGDWCPVPVVPPGTEADPAPPVLLNIGDLLSYWTGGLLRSTVHRVVFSPSSSSSSSSSSVVEGETDAEARYSIAFFFHPWGGAELGVVPSARVRAYCAGRQGGKGEGPKAGEGGNPYAERRVLTADEHLQMRYVLFITRSGFGFLIADGCGRLRASYAQLYKDKGEQQDA